jgi:hypothetical protein
MLLLLWRLLKIVRTWLDPAVVDKHPQQQQR